LTADSSLPLDIALVHYPVRNRIGEKIGSAVTNLDLHDIARTGRTYGARRFWVITPYDDQLRLVDEIVGHWRDGHGGRSNPDRKEAFSLVRTARTLDQAIAACGEAHSGAVPLVVATSASAREPQISFRALAERLLTPGPVLLLFGTASGMADEVFALCDYSLPPVGGAGEYNHLPVRAAAAIILDRLLGKRNG